MGWVGGGTQSEPGNGAWAVSGRGWTQAQMGPEQAMMGIRGRLRDLKRALLPDSPQGSSPPVLCSSQDFLHKT